MARKEFHFDFNEEADPVEELHRLRVAAAKHFKTMDAALEYLRSTPTAEEFLAQSDAKPQKTTPTKITRSRKTRSAGQASEQRKPAKRLTPA